MLTPPLPRDPDSGPWHDSEGAWYPTSHPTNPHPTKGPPQAIANILGERRWDSKHCAPRHAEARCIQFQGRGSAHSDKHRAPRHAPSVDECVAVALELAARGSKKVRSSRMTGPKCSMLLPCSCHVLATPLSCHCHVLAMLLPCPCLVRHALAMLSPCACHAIDMILHLTKAPALAETFGRHWVGVCVRAPAARKCRHQLDRGTTVGGRVCACVRACLRVRASLCA